MAPLGPACGRWLFRFLLPFGLLQASEHPDAVAEHDAPAGFSSRSEALLPHGVAQDVVFEDRDPSFDSAAAFHAFLIVECLHPGFEFGGVAGAEAAVHSVGRAQGFVGAEPEGGLRRASSVL